MKACLRCHQDGEDGTAFIPSFCNKKLIGARYFNKGFLASGGRVDEESDFYSARGYFGHGTHISSIEAGNHVLGVSHFGYARGTGTGMAPAQTIKNGAPWILTVGAGSIDRNFIGTMELGDGLKVEGISYFPVSIYIRGKGIYHADYGGNKTNCLSLALKDEVTGRIANSLSSVLYPEEFSFPTIFLNVIAGDVVKEYIRRESNAAVKSMRFMVTTLGTKPAPQLTYFSSRGPNPISPGILKQYILAPGQDVLAAMAPNKPFTTMGGYVLATDYGIYSGMSMAAPHVAGVAALVMAIHRDWSLII